MVINSTSVSMMIDEAMVSQLADWIKSHPHLPQKIEKLLLKRFIYSMSGDLDGAKKLFELNYSMRNKYPQIFLHRDPLDQSSQQLLQVADLVPLPGMTPEKNKVLFYRLIDFDVDKFDFTAGIKVFFMVADCRFAIEDEAGWSDGEIPIFDMAGFSLRHLTKTVLSSLRIYMKFVQEAHPVCLKQIHVLNCPSYLDKVMSIVKPFIKNEVFKLIHFHLPNSDTLFEYIPQEILPEEYGGEAGPIADIKKKWLKIIEDKRNYLMESERWQTEKLMKSPKNVHANLRTLDID